MFDNATGIHKMFQQVCGEVTLEQHRFFHGLHDYQMEEKMLQMKYLSLYQHKELIRTWKT